MSIPGPTGRPFSAATVRVELAGGAGQQAGTTRGTPMKKTIIVVRGFPNVGKSQTIRRAFGELRQEARVINPGRGYKEVRGGILEIDGVVVGFNSPGDVADPLEKELKRLIDGVKVGFNSPGDVADPLEED